MEKPHKIKLHILSPVHIGCDDVYEPTNFVIDEARKKLIEFDSLSFISNLTQQQRNEFVNLCSSEKLLAIYKFVKRVYNNKNPLREVDVTPGLVDHYKKVLSMTSYDNKNIINQFTMNKTSYNPVSYTHLRAHETVLDLVCRLLLEKKNILPIISIGALWATNI